MAEVGAAVLRLGSFWVQNSQKWELWVSKTTTTKKTGLFWAHFGCFWVRRRKNRKFESETTAAFGGKTALFGQRRGKKKSGVFGVKKSGFG